MKKKIFKYKKKIIISLVFVLIIFVLIINIDRLLPLSFKSYSSAIDLAKSYQKSRYCHESCWQKRYEDVEIIVLAAKKNKYQGMDKLMEYLGSNVVDDDFKNFIVSYLLSQDERVDKEYFKDYIANNLNNNNLNYMLKTKIIKHAGFDNKHYDLNLEKVILDNSISITQRKSALRALWSSFKSDNIYFFKDVLKAQDMPVQLKIEAIKALSNLDDKSNYLLASDLDIYENLLQEKDVNLEKSILFLLSDYQKKYPDIVSKIIESHNFANSNYLLANNILNS